MQLVEILIGAERFPVYREIGRREEELLMAMLGRNFHFVLDAGEPMDELLFDVLATVGASAEFFFSPPENAAVFGTFELKDSVVPSPGDRKLSGWSPRRQQRTTH